MAKMQQNTAAHEPSRQTCGNVIFYLGQKCEKKRLLQIWEHLLPSEMAHADFGPFSSVNFVKGRAELLSDPVSIMTYVKEGLHQTPSNSA